MTDINWVLYRIVVAAAGAAILGMVISTTCMTVAAFWHPLPPLVVLGGYIEFGICFGIAGAALGTIPGTFALCLSRAQRRPWHSLPILLTGALLGVVASQALLWALPSMATTLGIQLALLLGPTIGGFIASGFIKTDERYKYC
jgi:hypothetical protein